MFSNEFQQIHLSLQLRYHYLVNFKQQFIPVVPVVQKTISVAMTANVSGSNGSVTGRVTVRMVKMRRTAVSLFNFLVLFLA